ncbi:MAG: hypothetical protein K2X29_04485, partial [Candidatus Obscuribacterales bacterium]|nr:hypothetical protein [Candidatus Obscuribacterales bacterium]
LFSFLQIPVYYWLGLEITRCRLGGFVCMMLAGLSPFLLWYSQEARSYAVIYFLIPILCAQFFRVCRTEKRLDWIVYGFVAIACWYTTALTVFIMAGQALFLLLQEVKFENRKMTFRNIKRLGLPALTMGLSVVAASSYFLPGLGNIGYINRIMYWSFQKVASNELVDAWSNGPLSIFLQRSVGDTFTDLVIGFLTIFLLFGLVVGICLIFKIGDRNLLKICGLWILVTAVALHLPDLIFGGIRSTNIKYQPGMVMSVFVLSTYALVLEMRSSSKGLQVLGKISFLAIMAIELISSFNVSMRTERTKANNQSLREVVDVINKTKPDLVINGEYLEVQILAVAHYLKPDVKILFNASKDVEGLEYGVKRLILFDLTPEIREVVRTRGYRLSKVDGLDYLWRADKE